MDKSTCWFKQEQIVQEMNKNYPVYLKLMLAEETTHIKSIQLLIYMIALLENNKPTNVIDIGCGTAQISIKVKEPSTMGQIYPFNFTYTGADLQHIIDGCAKKWHPENLYLYFDISQNNIDFINQYDVVLLNAFIDVMENPLEILDKILSKAKKYVLLHRQEISIAKPTHTIKNDSYGGFTYHSIINRTDFENTLKKHNFKIIKELQCGFSNWENNGNSFLLEKK